MKHAELSLLSLLSVGLQASQDLSFVLHGITCPVKDIDSGSMDIDVGTHEVWFTTSKRIRKLTVTGCLLFNCKAQAKLAFKLYSAYR